MEPKESMIVVSLTETTVRVEIRHPASKMTENTVYVMDRGHAKATLEALLETK